jgi:hypothetical protein
MYTVVEDHSPYYIRYQHPEQDEIVRICQEYLAGLKPADHFTHHKVDPQTAQRIADLIPIGRHIPIMLERISLFITPPGVYYPAHKDGVDHRCSLNYAVKILDNTCPTRWYADADVLPHYTITDPFQYNRSREARYFRPNLHTPVCSLITQPGDVLLFNTDIFHDFDNRASHNERVVLTVRFAEPEQHYFDDVKKMMFGPDTLEKQREAPTF